MNLNTQQDGRRLAVRVLAELRDAGTEKCRCNGTQAQADALIAALVDLKERGTVAALVGFAVVLTDALGTRGLEPVPEFYDELERQGKYTKIRLRRLVRSGRWLMGWANVTNDWS